jgi:formylglycine-generating enzyme required for sulfatase activity
MNYVGDAFIGRGGGCKDVPRYVRSGFRNPINIYGRADDIGFRIIRPE